VGKSSVINALTARHGATGKACPVGAQAGVTTSIRKVKVDNKLNILDSPGIVFPSSEKKRSPVEEQARLVLLNALPPKQIDDPRPAVSLLLKRLGKNEEQNNRLKKYYDMPSMITTPHDSYVSQFLIHVARKMGRLGKAGVPDLTSAAMAVINDWRDGRIAGWAMAPSSQPAQSESSTSQPVIVTEWAKEFSLEGLWDLADAGDDKMDD
jgi:nuclear GTP-binding protein